MIAGGRGLLGDALRRALQPSNDVVILSRSGDGDRRWDGRTLGDWIGNLDGAMAVINLTGESVQLPWTPANRKRILDSRVESTAIIRRAIESVANPPKVWINASAVGIYGDRGDDWCDESSTPGTGFLAEVTKEWEDASRTDTVLLRTGVVLAREGGAFPKLAGLTKWFAGGALGSGRQFVPWIHIDDWVGLVLWRLAQPSPGPINLTAPNPVRNTELMAALRKRLGRPWSPAVPEFAMRIFGKVMGPDAEAVLASQRVRPAEAIKGGFAFQFPTIDDALRDLSAYPRG